MNSLGISNRGAVNDIAVAAALMELMSQYPPQVQPNSERLSDVTYIFEVQDVVNGPHGVGVISGYNHNGGIYNGHRFPYCVLFEDGYHDVYSDNDLTRA